MWLGIANHSITPKQKNHRRTQISTPRQNSHCITARNTSADRSWSNDGSNARLEDGDLKKQSPKNSGRPPKKPEHPCIPNRNNRPYSATRHQGRKNARMSGRKLTQVATPEKPLNNSILGKTTPSYARSVG